MILVAAPLDVAITICAGVTYIRESNKHARLHNTRK